LVGFSLVDLAYLRHSPFRVFSFAGFFSLVFFFFAGPIFRWLFPVVAFFLVLGCFLSVAL